jgi:uncharacterized protein (DUF305 family)
MTKTIKLTLLAIAAAASVAGACASSSASSPDVRAGAVMPPVPASGPVAATPAPSSPAAIAQARADSMRRPYTQADIEFMQGMIGHHSQAVLMASWCKSHNASPGLQTFCGRIATAQLAEINLMQTWLRDRNQKTPEADPRGMMMNMAGMDHMMLMPGMLTEEQMAQLDKARGKEFDRLFLTYMMQHHNGAITMVNKLFATDGAGQDEFTFKFANDVQADQMTEIDRMQQMLDAIR